MKFIAISIFAFIAVAYTFADDTIYDWTNLEGKTIKARYLKSDDRTVTINMAGRIFDYPLSNLNPSCFPPMK